MNPMTKPATNFSIQASLDELHRDSVAWKSEIEFWQDEVNFFYKLIRKRGIKEAFPSEEIAEIEKNLISLSAEKLVNAKERIARHERQLVMALNSSSFSNGQAYWETHKALSTEMANLYSDMKSYKQNLFQVIEKYE